MDFFFDNRKPSCYEVTKSGYVLRPRLLKGIASHINPEFNFSSICGSLAIQKIKPNLLWWRWCWLALSPNSVFFFLIIYYYYYYYYI